MKGKKTKQKTRKSITRRLKVTKTGKVIFRGSHNRHLKRKKSKSQARSQKVPKRLLGRLAQKIKKII